MKSREEAVLELLEEDRRYSRLIRKYQGDQAALATADELYQEGVRVSEIAQVLEDDERGGEDER
ncbi:MAG TPA: hypothetical protein PK263_04670 [bacterium]|nr:hypothetical protein [bacterium]